MQRWAPGCGARVCTRGCNRISSWDQSKTAFLSRLAYPSHLNTITNNTFSDIHISSYIAMSFLRLTRIFSMPYVRTVFTEGGAGTVRHHVHRKAQLGAQARLNGRQSPWQTATLVHSVAYRAFPVCTVSCDSVTAHVHRFA